jgi:hypothetical protein
MSRKLIILATVSGLALTSAWAQSPPTTAPTSDPAATPAPAQILSTKPTFISRQNPDQWVMSKFKGTNVLGLNDEKIGDVNDIVFDKNGSILAYVVGVGGFLGIGSKDVGLTPASFQVVKGDVGAADKLKVTMTKDDLNKAPAFEYYAPAPPRGAANTQRPRPAPATQ